MSGKAGQEETGYNVTITGRHVQVTDAMKDYALEKFSKLERFSPNQIIDLHVTIDIQKLLHRVKAEMKFGHYYIQVSAESDDMYKSIDKSVERLERKLRKYKVKLQNHNRSPLQMVDMQVNILKTNDRVDEINEEIDEANRQQMEDTFAPHQIVKEEQRPLKTLTTGHALMKMELSDKPLLVYRCEEDQKIKVLYRREDGDYEIISPE